MAMPLEIKPRVEVETFYFSASTVEAVGTSGAKPACLCYRWQLRELSRSPIDPLTVHPQVTWGGAL
jgi:hypothetical protein